jgi:dienelactone hydrolase
MPPVKQLSPLFLFSLLAFAGCSAENNDSAAMPGGEPIGPGASVVVPPDEADVNSGVAEGSGAVPETPVSSVDQGTAEGEGDDSNQSGDGGILIGVPDTQTPDQTVPDEQVPDEQVPDEQVPDEVVPDNSGFPAESACLAGIVSFDRDGPFKYDTERSGEVKLKIPQVPAGCKVPVVHLANGTGATCITYDSIMQRLASHGFITACYEDTNTGAGTQGIEAISTVLASYGELAAMRIGSMGHSQGGQAAFTVLEQAEAKWADSAIYAGLAMQPASGFGEQPTNGSWTEVYGRIKSPMFMFSGTADVLVSKSWVTSAISALDDQVEAYHWSAIGATHIPTPNGETAEVAVPWFRWKLLGDEKACEAFSALRGTSGWEMVEEHHAASCK